MPEMNGIDFMQYAALHKPAISVAMLTTVTENDKIIKCLQLGAIDYIFKPFRADELVAKINLLFEIANERNKILINSKSNIGLTRFLNSELLKNDKDSKS